MKTSIIQQLQLVPNKGSIADVYDEPFVCHTEPFVCLDDNFILPFVGNIKPFVGFIGFYRGFTLIELIVVLAIAGILAGLAVPSFNRFLESNRLVAVTNDLIADLNVAKSEAIKLGSQAAVCSTADGASCAASNNWATGWLAFVDADNSSGLSAGDTVIKVHEAVTGGINVTSPANIVVYRNIGTVASGSGDFTICNSKIKSQRRISINALGRSSLLQETC